MKNTIKSLRDFTRDTVCENVATYLVARKAYSSYEEAIEDCYINEDMVKDTIVYLGTVLNDPYAESIYMDYESVTPTL